MKNKQTQKREKRTVRRKRIRSTLAGTAVRPRLSIYRSNKTIYAQLIDDDKGATIVSGETGKDIATKAIAKGIKKVVFDRGGFIYTGRVKTFAEEARAAGLEF